MKSISLNITKAASFLAEGAVKAYEPKVKAAQEALENGTCEGNDFLGWLHLPSSITPEFIDEIQAVANTLREKCEVVVVAGIGGSYLGARAVIEGLGNSFAWLVADKKNPTILFAGNNIFPPLEEAVRGPAWQGRGQGCHRGRYRRQEGCCSHLR